MALALGLDYGTNSVRAVLVDCADGAEVATHVFPYPSGQQGILLDPDDHHLARQNPADYLPGLRAVVRGVIDQVTQAGTGTAADIIGIGIDATGSSPIPVDQHNQPLALQDRWHAKLAAHCWLWKDHTAHREAAEITRLALDRRPHYLAQCGNTYSSEWFWAKILHCLRTAPDVFAAAHSWVELADWVPAVLAGIDDPCAIRRGVCPAGHKALYSAAWGGLPDKAFLDLLDPRLGALRDRLYDRAYDAATPAGQLCADWAEQLGLTPGIPIAIGAFDVHYGAIGCGVREGTLVKVIGTSGCDCLVADARRRIAAIPGICGIVEGSILPGHWGIEAGQSAVGDKDGAGGHDRLTREVAHAAPGQSGLLALDWNNGNRTILVDQRLSGLLLGQTLHSNRAEIYRALIEATAFGARRIIEHLLAHDVPIERIVCAGGIAEKNRMLLQIYADVTGCDLFITRSSQACALGAAIAAAALAGAARGGHATLAAAQAAMTGDLPDVCRPDARHRAVYDQLYGLYRQLHDAFGGVDHAADLGHVMKDLMRIKEQARAAVDPGSADCSQP
jgi:L-ribulokinase